MEMLLIYKEDEIQITEDILKSRCGERSEFPIFSFGFETECALRYIKEGR